MRSIVLAALLSAPLMACVETSGPVLTGQRAHIAQVLPYYGYRDVDVRSLRTSQVAQIAHLAHSGRSYGDTRGQIGAVLRGGLLQRTIEDVLR